MTLRRIRAVCASAPRSVSAARRRAIAALCASLGVSVGCSSSDEPPTPGSQAAANTTTTGGFTAASTGAANAGLSNSAVSNTVAAASTGTQATTTGFSTSGAGTTGAVQGTTGAGGASSTGPTFGGTTDSGQGGSTANTTGMGTSTGSAMGGSGGGTLVDVQPSPGCSSGSSSPSLNLPNTLVDVPPAYDGSTPVPVVMAFHPAGNPNTSLQNRLGDDLNDKYLVLYPKSDGSGWNDNADAPKVEAMFDALTSQACIDENRVFATGHSSGAQFIVQRLCADETRWRAVAPVASSVYCDSWNPVPALVIHGIGDVERSWDPDGEDDIVPYRTSNDCQSSSNEFPVDSCESGGTQVDPGCVQFDGCSETTIWCQHDDPQYGTSHHGIPCFGDSLIREFFDSY